MNRWWKKDSCWSINNETTTCIPIYSSSRFEYQMSVFRIKTPAFFLSWCIFQHMHYFKLLPNYNLCFSAIKRKCLDYQSKSGGRSSSANCHFMRWACHHLRKLSVPSPPRPVTASHAIIMNSLLTVMDVWRPWRGASVLMRRRRTIGPCVSVRPAFPIYSFLSLFYFSYMYLTQYFYL